MKSGKDNVTVVMDYKQHTHKGLQDYLHADSKFYTILDCDPVKANSIIN